MRKKTFLKAVCLFACLSILMLSVPGATALPRADKKAFTYHRMIERATMLFSFLSFLNLPTNNEKGDTSSDTASSNDSDRIIKITGMLRKSLPSKRD